MSNMTHLTVLFLKRVIVPVAYRLRPQYAHTQDQRDSEETYDGLFLHNQDKTMLSHIEFRSKLFVTPRSYRRNPIATVRT